LNVLSWNSFVPAGNIRVAVHEGWITLTGEKERPLRDAVGTQARNPLAGL
jgi:hypothetical protein